MHPAQPELYEGLARKLQNAPRFHNEEILYPPPRGSKEKQKIHKYNKTWNLNPINFVMGAIIYSLTHT